MDHRHVTGPDSLEPNDRDQHDRAGGNHETQPLPGGSRRGAREETAMMLYSAVDIVSQMHASLAEEPVRRRRSMLGRLIALVALVELTALWGAAGALTSLT